MNVADYVVLALLAFLVVAVCVILHRQNKRAKSEGRCAFCSEKNHCASCQKRDE